MAKPAASDPHVQAGEVQSVDPHLERLLQICGISELPRAHTTVVPLERIVLSNEALARPSARLVRSIKQVGIRQPPSVAFRHGTSWEAEDAIDEVIMGRRRIASARQLAARGDPRFKRITCEVYEVFHPRLAAFLALVENGLREDAWRQDVLHLHHLVCDGVPMTLDDLAASGFNRRTIRARLHLALLPEALFTQIVRTPEITQDVALQILRLSEAERAQLTERCQAGIPLTPALVRGMLKRQIDRTLAALPADLSDYWTAPPAPPMPSAQADVSPETCSFAHLLTVLRLYEPFLQADPALHQAFLLTQVLIEELAIATRQTSQTEGVPSHG